MLNHKESQTSMRIAASLGRYSRQEGSILVLVIMLLPVLIGLAGLSIDLGNILYRQQKMQDAVDLAALAGAQVIMDNTGNAVQTAKDYGELNGLRRGSMRVKSPYEGDPNKIYVEVTEIVNYFFLPIFGIDSKEITVSATAEAISSTYNPNFAYALFSGSKTLRFDMPGSRNIINGKVHVNADVKMSGKENSFNDRFECAGDFEAHPENYFESLYLKADYMPMVNYDIEELKSRATEVYNENVSFSKIEIDGIIFVDGSVNISGGEVRGKGTIIATENINISASRMVYESADDLIAFYALGEIQISGSDIVAEGIFYAPNSFITIPGSRNQFYGAFIADQIKISGSDSLFTYDVRAREALGGSGRIIHLVQ